MSYFIQIHKIAMRVFPIEHLWPHPHLHTHLELIYLKEGQCEVLLDNQRFLIHANEIFIAFPNQIHAYYELSPVKGYVMILALDHFQEFHEIFKNKLPEYPLLNTNCFSMDIEEHIKKIRENLKAKIDLGNVIAKGQLLNLLGEMFVHMNFIKKTMETETMTRILNYCMEHYTEPFTLDKMAKELYLSKYYICHIFRERLNMNCKEFVNQLRVEAACDLLKKDVSVTDTAYTVGFSSVRTFNRIFTQFMKMNPRDYRKISK